MDPHKLQLKIFFAADVAQGLALDPFIPVFHRWIQERTLPELVIDVANYAHVPEGPGVVLIGHSADYFIDQGAGRTGLLYSRKRPGPSSATNLSDLARRTLHAALRLESEPSLAGKLRFSTSEMLFRVNDRLAAPNDSGTFAKLRPELDRWARQMFGSPVELAPVGGRKELFGVRVASPEEVPLALLLDRAGGPPTPDSSLVG